MILDPITMCQMSNFSRSCEWNNCFRDSRPPPSKIMKVSVIFACQKKMSHAGHPNPEATFKLCFVFLVEVEETCLTYSSFLQAH